MKQMKTIYHMGNHFRVQVTICNKCETTDITKDAEHYISQDHGRVCIDCFEKETVGLSVYKGRQED